MAPVLIRPHVHHKDRSKDLKIFLDQRFCQELQHPWLLKLVDFDYVVEYKRGVENKVVDALSRRNEETEEEEGDQTCRTVSVVESN